MENLDSIVPSLKNLTVKTYGNPKQNQHEPIQELARPHLDSFNVMIKDDGISRLMQDVLIEFSLPNTDDKGSSVKISLYYKSVTVAKPEVEYGKKSQLLCGGKLYPKECRLRGISYTGRVTAKIGWKFNGQLQDHIERCIGSIPIMVKSDLCHLNGLNPQKLVQHGEEAEELGGYFIVNGIERIIRMLIQQRRNMAIAIQRPTWKAKRLFYTEYGVIMRCVKKDDQTICSNTLHYLSNGAVELSFTYNKQQFFIPIMLLLLALTDEKDVSIVRQLSVVGEDAMSIKNSAKNMLSVLHENNIFSRTEALKYIGKLFRVKLSVPEWYKDVEVGQHLIRKCICIHVDSDKEKFNVLVEMAKKLYRYAKGKCCTESSDNASFQEVLTAGHLYQLTFKEHLESWLIGLKFSLLKHATTSKLSTIQQVKDALMKAFRTSNKITPGMTKWIGTGSITGKSGLGLMQTTGLTVVADKLNFIRYLSHFRAIHRGSFFQETKTTEVRKLTAQTWGFLCPVHTPDGSPCGLLNHMTAMCRIVNSPYMTSSLERLLYEFGVVPYDAPFMLRPYSEHYVVHLDGKIIGWIRDTLVTDVVDQLRYMKVNNLEKVPEETEICLVPKRQVAAQDPGLFLFTTMGRMVRPVMNLKLNKVEIIGSFEQSYFTIAPTNREAEADETIMYKELSQLGLLSEMAAMTPFSDYNQSCRNMYQCQMGKQTMGVPLHAWNYRSDNKLYRLHFPQSPIVRTAMYDYLNADEYPIGTNAVVAVMSYTGYDMEDAMTINKSSYERGFGHGTIVKTQVIDLSEISGEKKKTVLVFENKSTDVKVNANIDADGLPFPGTILDEKDPFYSYYNLETRQYTVAKYDGHETAYVQQVMLTSNTNAESDGPCQRALVTLRVPRKPVIGDKFSSRHGQKGVCSVFYPVEDMPFTLSGMTPDIIFNPHGFPSRMTVGMMIEIMAGKCAAEKGICHNASPFLFTEQDGEETSAVDFFQECLVNAGFNYLGTEVMCCGSNGRLLTTYIFKGVVYYQRLRHMVLDKWQVRMTGPIDMTTQQPVGGRKRGGGIRFGEMERDALIAHGASALLQDRLFNCSDGMTMHACKKCGSIVSPIYGPSPNADTINLSAHWRCLVCPDDGDIVTVSVPYIFKYFVMQLAAMNIKTKLDIRPI